MAPKRAKLVVVLDGLDEPFGGNIDEIAHSSASPRETYELGDDDLVFDVAVQARLDVRGVGDVFELWAPLALVVHSCGNALVVHVDLKQKVEVMRANPSLVDGPNPEGQRDDLVRSSEHVGLVQAARTYAAAMVVDVEGEVDVSAYRFLTVVDEAP